MPAAHHACRSCCIAQQRPQSRERLDARKRLARIVRAAGTAVALVPPRAQARPRWMPSVKTVAKMSSKKEAKAPPMNQKLPSAKEAAMAVANPKAKVPAERREHGM